MAELSSGLCFLMYKVVKHVSIFQNFRLGRKLFLEIVQIKTYLAVWQPILPGLGGRRTFRMKKKSKSYHGEDHIKLQTL